MFLVTSPRQMMIDFGVRLSASVVSMAPKLRPPFGIVRAEDQITVTFGNSEHTSQLNVQLNGELQKEVRIHRVSVQAMWNKRPKSVASR